jgi:SAM-dependent methyltransferase
MSELWHEVDIAELPGPPAAEVETAAEPQRLARYGRVHDLLAPECGSGLEVGPLYDPMVRRHEADVRYVDLHPVDLLREHYSNHPGVPLDDIVDPDFHLIGPDGTRSLPEAVQAAAPFDWVVASHVIEHVPDLIGWLDEVAQILVDDGRLVLAIPDRRFCFDAIREPTSIGEMLLAHRNGDRAPSVRAVYDHYSRAIILDPPAAWAGEPPNPAGRIHSQAYALERVRRQQEGQYVDCHVWLFTPASFVEQLVELESLGQTSFIIDELIPCAPNELEFYARLRRVPRALDPAEREAVRRTGIRTWVDRELDRLPAPEPEPGRLISDRELKAILVKRRLMIRLRRLFRVGSAV